MATVRPQVLIKRDLKKKNDEKDKLVEKIKSSKGASKDRLESVLRRIAREIVELEDERFGDWLPKSRIKNE